MLILESRDICGAATGRNGRFSPQTFSRGWEGLLTNEIATQEGSWDHTHIRVTQRGPADSGQMEPMHSSSTKWHISLPSENSSKKKGLLRKSASSLAKLSMQRWRMKRGRGSRERMTTCGKITEKMERWSENADWLKIRKVLRNLRKSTRANKLLTLEAVPTVIHRHCLLSKYLKLSSHEANADSAFM